MRDVRVIAHRSTLVVMFITLGMTAWFCGFVIGLAVGLHAS